MSEQVDEALEMLAREALRLEGTPVMSDGRVAMAVLLAGRAVALAIRELSDVVEAAS